MTNTVNFEQLSNIAVVDYQLDQLQLAPIHEEVAAIRRANLQLATEYKLPKSHAHVSQLLAPLVAEYDRRSSILIRSNQMTQDGCLVLDDLWVNFQRAGEFNSPHRHPGVLSFVIWLDIPYLIEDERDLATRQRDYARTSTVIATFQFLYTNILGEITQCNLPVDSRWNGRMAMWPSSLLHAVYPFMSTDQYRVSVSGNLRWSANK
jgi:hypothetical protein